MTWLSLPEAVARYAPDGSRVYVGNFGAQLFCVGHELIRQGRRELDIVIASGGLLLDQLFGAGVVRTATFGDCWSPVGPAPAWNFRRLAESGAAAGRLHELPLGWLTAALAAGARVISAEVAEETVPTAEVLAVGVTLPALVVGAVVTRPGAVRPEGALGRYDRDVAAYRGYSAASRTANGFRQWMRTEVLDHPEPA
jgi:acyl CoA:acetate/3-ketoacid CoA transferase alpha subunit